MRCPPAARSAARLGCSVANQPRDKGERRLVVARRPEAALAEDGGDGAVGVGDGVARDGDGGRRLVGWEVADDAALREVDELDLWVWVWVWV